MRRPMAWLMVAMLGLAGVAWSAQPPAAPAQKAPGRPHEGAILAAPAPQAPARPPEGAKAPVAPHRGGIPAAPARAAQEGPPTDNLARAAKAMGQLPRAPKGTAPGEIEGRKPIAPDSQPPYVDPDALPSNVVKVLRTSDKAQTNNYVPIVFDLNNVCPFNVIRFLRRPVQTEEGMIFTFVDDTGTHGKVLYVVPPYMIPSLSELVNAVDRKGLTSSSGDYHGYLQLKHRRAHATDQDFLDTAQSFLTGNGEIFLADSERNALDIKDAPSGGLALEEALTQWLDVPTAMLDLVVKVYELDAVNEAQLGLDYMAWKNGPGADLFAVGAYAEHGGFGRREGVATAPALPRNNFTASGYNYAFRYDVSSAFFDFLVARGKARILNESKIATLNTRPAELTVGDQVLFYEVLTSDPSGVRQGGEPFDANRGRVVVGTTHEPGSVKPVQTGLTLKATPFIAQQAVKLLIDITWTDYTFVEDTGFPVMATRHLATAIGGKIGEEFMIGGLERQIAVKSTRKAPLLGSIPILGWAFGGETSPAQKSELVVLITPAAVMQYNLAKTEAERDYRVKPGEQETIDQANGAAPMVEPRAKFGFDQLGLDPDFGKPAADLK